jgi:transposase
MPPYLSTYESRAIQMEREYGVAVSPTTGRRHLKACGMCAQKPVRRAYEGSGEGIAEWSCQRD